MSSRNYCDTGPTNRIQRSPRLRRGGASNVIGAGSLIRNVGVTTCMPGKSLIAAAGAVLVVVVAATVVPAFIRARSTPAMNACANNLRQLDGAKQTWALENHKGTNDIITWDDVRAYLRWPLVCPQRRQLKWKLPMEAAEGECQLTSFDE